MKSYRELEIYKESKRLAIEVHAMTLELPKFEMYEEGGQVRRSSKSVTSMIVEGYGRRAHKADFVKYLVYSQSECDETIVHLDFLFETGSSKATDKIERLKNDYHTLSKRINKYIQWVEEYFTPNYNVQEPSLSDCTVTPTMEIHSWLQHFPAPGNRQLATELSTIF